MLTVLKVSCLAVFCLCFGSAALACEGEQCERERELTGSLILCQAWSEHCSFAEGRIFFTRGPLYYRHLFMESGDTHGLFALCGLTGYPTCTKALVCLSRKIGEREDMTGILIDVSDMDLEAPSLWGMRTKAIELRRDYVLGAYQHATSLFQTALVFSLGMKKDDWCS